MNKPAIRNPKSELELIRWHLGTLRRRKYLVLSIFCVISVAAGVVAWALPNVYRSSTMILVERQKVPETYVRSTVSETMQERLKTITQEILSRSQIKQVVEEYGLLDEPTAGERVMERLHLSGAAWTQAVGRFFGWLPEEGKGRTVDQMVGEFKKRVTVKVVGHQAFSVAYEGYDPVTVMQVANAMAGMFIAENLRVRETMVEDTTQFLESELDLARNELEKQEAAVQQFRTEHLGTLPEQLDANLRTLDRIQLELKHIDDSLATLTQQRTFYQKQRFLTEQQLADLSGSGGLASGGPLDYQLADAEQRLTVLLTRYTEEYPEVIQLRAQIKELKARIAEQGTGGTASGSEAPVVVGFARQVAQIDGDIAKLKARQARLEEDARDYERRVETTPSVEQELQKLQRDYKVMQDNYQSLLGKQMNARLAQNLERRQKGEQFRVIDPANLPAHPSSPNRQMLFLLGCLFGLGLGAGSAIGLDVLRPRFHTAEDVVTVLDMPVLATIPKYEAVSRGS